ncbi:MAG: beta-lactamase family protein [Candidatus Thiodiazotropha sp. (ex Dulcina madagascariensis)]|nr:beta-lactamase family protein [Candidatus Thiodiazotropha sp. (ex Dulcina madagascariensis)]MCU7928030.1 beta-lactamase family protein [Candidatus Thiodiazotropha sp. (ex Dulcina madagascariensis)]
MSNNDRTWISATGSILLMACLGIIFLSGCNSNTNTRKTTTERFQDTLDNAVSEGLPAVAVTIKGGNIDFYGAAGMADLQTAEALTPEHRFYVASIGKTFLAATTVQLAADGLLNLDDAITAWLPGSVTERIPSSSDITIRMLLNHSSGIYDFQNDGEAWDNDFYAIGPDQQWQNSDVLPYILDRPLHFPPGTDYRYSNSNYILVALIVETATGETIQNVIRNRVIEPLGLLHTLHGDETAGLPGLAHGYFNDEGERLDVYPWVSHYGLADGGMQTTAGDLADFLLGLLKTDKVLDDAMRTEMMTPSGLGNPPSTYGLGIDIIPVSATNTVIYTHGGKDPGYQATMLYIAGKDTVITICASGSFGDYDPVYEQLLPELFALLEELQTGT